MNWLGNIEAPAAAGNLLGQAGIPHTLLRSGGEVTHVRMEHVWAQAWVDFVPSRGAKHKVGDHWIPMDASFKQYDYTEGMNLKDEVPFDAEGLANTIEEQSTINESEGWVQDVPQQEIETAITDYRDQLESYLNNQAPDATVGEVLGTQSIREVIHKQLSAGLPYRQVTRELTTSALPEDLRWKFRYQINNSQDGIVGSTLIKMERSTVELAGEQLGLSFKPATPEDEETLKSHLPEPGEDGEIDPAELPDTLPGYLIHLKSEFRLGDEVVATADTETDMGAELHSEMGYWQPGQGWQTSENRPIAGEYRAIGLNLQGISQEQAKRAQTDLESTKDKLDNGDFSGLTKQQVVGDLLYSTILSYMSLNDIQDKMAERQVDSVGYRSPSYGLFKTSLSPVYWYGVPRDVKADGLGMDVDRMKNVRVDKENDSDQWLAYNRMQGARQSVMENLVPERMYSTEDGRAKGISAVKAIQMADAQGQKTYTITDDNLSGALGKIGLPEDVKEEIEEAVKAGNKVTTHEKPVSFSGKEVSGYVIIDPRSGAGAYKIQSGENGSFIDVIGWIKAALFGKLSFNSILVGLKKIAKEIAKKIARANILIGFVVGILDLIKGCAASQNYTLAMITFTIIAVALILLALLIPGFIFYAGLMIGLAPLGLKEAFCK